MIHVIENIKYAQAPKWDGKENDLDKRDRETSELTKSSIISKEQLEIDQGKMKKVKSEKVCPNFLVTRKFRISEFFGCSKISIARKFRPFEFFDCPNFSVVVVIQISEFFGYSEFSILRIFRLYELFDFRIFVEPLNSLNFVSCNRFFRNQVISVHFSEIHFKKNSQNNLENRNKQKKCITLYPILYY